MYGTEYLPQTTTDNIKDQKQKAAFYGERHSKVRVGYQLKIISHYCMPNAKSEQKTQLNINIYALKLEVIHSHKQNILLSQKAN